MSLADRWKKYLESLNLRMDHSESFRQEITERKRAFYAGAEATLEHCGLDADERQDLRAEIDHFRSHK